MIVARLIITTFSLGKTLILAFMFMEYFFSPLRLPGIFGLNHKDIQIKLAWDN